MLCVGFVKTCSKRNMAAHGCSDGYVGGHLLCANFSMARFSLQLNVCSCNDWLNIVVDVARKLWRKRVSKVCNGRINKCCECCVGTTRRQIKQTSYGRGWNEWTRKCHVAWQSWRGKAGGVHLCNLFRLFRRWLAWLPTLLFLLFVCVRRLKVAMSLRLGSMEHMVIISARACLTCPAFWNVRSEKKDRMTLLLSYNTRT